MSGIIHIATKFYDLPAYKFGALHRTYLYQNNTHCATSSDTLKILNALAYYL